MTEPFVSSSCRVLEKKAHLVQPYLFTEEHGNLRNEASNQRSDRKLATEVVSTLTGKL